MKLRHSSVNIYQTLLSRKELLGISNEISKRFTPVKPIKVPELGNDIKFSSKELLEVSQNISLYYAPSISPNTKRLVLLPIDPHHLYAYWSLGDNETNRISQTLIDSELALRVYSKSVEGLGVIKEKPVIEIAVHEVQARKRIKLPVAALNAATVYSASIGEYIPENGFVPLLESNNTHVFQGIDSHKEGGAKGNYSLDSSNIENKVLQTSSIDQGFKNKDTLYDKTLSVKSHYASSNCSGQNNK